MACLRTTGQRAGQQHEQWPDQRRPDTAGGDLASGARPGAGAPGGSGEGSAPIARESPHSVSGRVACWRQANDVHVGRCPPRDEIARRAGLTLMLSHRANVASIVSRRAELAGLGDLIKPSIVHKYLPEAPILPDLLAAGRTTAHSCITEPVSYGNYGPKGRRSDRLVAVKIPPQAAEELLLVFVVVCHRIVQLTPMSVANGPSVCRFPVVLVSAAPTPYRRENGCGYRP